jgi:uncharacterized membrane protein
MLPLNLFDWIALSVFAACWLGYANVVDRVPAIRARSVIMAMDEHRRRWMLATLARDNRIADIAAIGNLMQSTGFSVRMSFNIDKSWRTLANHSADRRSHTISIRPSP